MLIIPLQHIVQCFKKDVKRKSFTNIWLLSSVEKCKISIRFQVRCLCSSHGYLSTPAPISSDGNTTPKWTHLFLPFFQWYSMTILKAPDTCTKMSFPQSPFEQRLNTTESLLGLKERLKVKDTKKQGPP